MRPCGYCSTLFRADSRGDCHTCGAPAMSGVALAGTRGAVPYELIKFEAAQEEHTMDTMIRKPFALHIL